jgi:hypothetical protein
LSWKFYEIKSIIFLGEQKWGFEPLKMGWDLAAKNISSSPSQLPSP